MQTWQATSNSHMRIIKHRSLTDLLSDPPCASDSFVTYLFVCMGQDTKLLLLTGGLPYSAPTGVPTGAPASGMALAPGQFLNGAPGPAPMIIGVPAPAPSQAALCACNPADTSARSVKIEVLSTAYNSSSTDTIKFNAYLTFSHPVRSLNSSQVRVFTRQTSEDGTKTTVPGVVSLLSPVRILSASLVSRQHVDPDTSPTMCIHTTA